MNFKYRAQINVGVFQYPYAEKINPILHNTIKENLDLEHIGTRQTHWNCRSREFKIIGDYVEGLLKNGYMGNIVFDESSVQGPLVLLSLWGMWYDNGIYQESHHHTPAHWSFVYYVNTPKGSSPLVFDSGCNKKIYPKSGDVVIFPGWLKHHVPPNKCEGRTSVVGNFYHRLPETRFTNIYSLK